MSRYTFFFSFLYHRMRPLIKAQFSKIAPVQVQRQFKLFQMTQLSCTEKNTQECIYIHRFSSTFPHAENLCIRTYNIYLQ